VNMKQRQNIVSALNVISNILLTSALDRVEAEQLKKCFGIRTRWPAASPNPKSGLRARETRNAWNDAPPGRTRPGIQSAAIINTAQNNSVPVYTMTGAYVNRIL